TPQTSQRLAPTHGGEVFPVNESCSAGPRSSRHRRLHFNRSRWPNLASRNSGKTWSGGDGGEIWVNANKSSSCRSRNNSRATTQTSQRLAPTHGGEVFPVNESCSAGPRSSRHRRLHFNRSRWPNLASRNSGKTWSGGDGVEIWVNAASSSSFRSSNA